jgi:hypothetical protein
VYEINILGKKSGVELKIYVALMHYGCPLFAFGRAVSASRYVASVRKRGFPVTAGQWSPGSQSHSYWTFKLLCMIYFAFGRGNSWSVR